MASLKLEIVKYVHLLQPLSRIHHVDKTPILVERHLGQGIGQRSRDPRHQTGKLGHPVQPKGMNK